MGLSLLKKIKSETGKQNNNACVMKLKLNISDEL